MYFSLTGCNYLSRTRCQGLIREGGWQGVKIYFYYVYLINMFTDHDDDAAAVERVEA